MNEPKLSFSEREGVDICFKTSSLGGSFFEYIEEEKYMKMDFNEQLEVAKKVVIDKMMEKNGYQIIKLDFINRMIFNYQTNEYVWSFVIEVNKNSTTYQEVENEIDDIYSTQWFNYEDLTFLEDGKFKSILFDYFIRNNIVKFN